MARPTTSEIKDRILGSLRASLALVASPRRTIIGALANSFAAMAYILYTYADNLFAESHPLNATGERLDLWGQIFRLPRNPASFATISVTVRGTPDSTIPQGQELKTTQDQFFVSTELVRIGADSTAT